MTSYIVCLRLTSQFAFSMYFIVASLYDCSYSCHSVCMSCRIKRLVTYLLTYFKTQDRIITVISETPGYSSVSIALNCTQLPIHRSRKCMHRNVKEMHAVNRSNTNWHLFIYRNCRKLMFTYSGLYLLTYLMYM